MPPRLLIVGAFPGSAPLERYIGGALAERLRGSDWQVRVVSRQNRRIARLADMLQVVFRQRAHYDLALVEVYSGPAFLWAELVCFALRCLRKPYVLALHGGDLPAFSQRHPSRVRSLLRSATAVTCPSAYLSEGVKSCWNAIQLLPNPIDLSLYRFTERQALRPALVWLRAFHEIYNPCLAPRVVASLVKTFPGIHLEMLGPDKGDGSLQRAQKLALELGVADRIRFLGPVSKKDVPAILNRADIFLNTTNFDNTPVSVIEAMACGLCVVSTDAGGMPYLVENGNEGLLVPRNDPAAMADAIEHLLKKPGLAPQLSRHARLKVEQFDWSVILPLWQQLLNGGANARGPVIPAPSLRFSGKSTTLS